MSNAFKFISNDALIFVISVFSMHRYSREHRFSVCNSFSFKLPEINSNRTLSEAVSIDVISV